MSHKKQRAQYPLAPKDVAQACLDEASAWRANNLTAHVMWSSAGYAAKTAVAEYIANKKGYTLYENCAKKFYAGIGSRQTPPEILMLMGEIAKALEKQGYTLRSGGAQGADSAFAEPIHDNNKEIWTADFATDKAINVAAQHHPAWHHCKPYVRKLHGRNAQIVLGYELDSPVEFVICWTYKGNQQGGTALGMRIAEARGIPVYNLAIAEDIEKVKKLCNL